MTDRVRVRITGRVQGVGFRFCASREAHALGLHGWVQNMPDGRVEGEFEGARELLERMVAWCERGPSYAHVERVDVEWESGPARHATFVIR